MKKPFGALAILIFFFSSNPVFAFFFKHTHEEKKVESRICVRATPNAPQTLSFQGELAESHTGLVTSLALTGEGAASNQVGTHFYRTNAAGDRLDVYINGKSVSAVVEISAITSRVIFETDQICGIYMDTSVVQETTQGGSANGNIGGGVIALFGQVGYLRDASGQLILL